MQRSEFDAEAGRLLFLDSVAVPGPPAPEPGVRRAAVPGADTDGQLPELFEVWRHPAYADLQLEG